MFSTLFLLSVTILETVEQKRQCTMNSNYQRYEELKECKLCITKYDLNWNIVDENVKILEV